MSKPSVHDYEDFEYDTAFRAKWDPVVDEIGAALDRAREFGVPTLEKPKDGGSWLMHDFDLRWVPVRPHIEALQNAFNAAMKEYQADWLKVRFRSERAKRNEAPRRPNFTEWDQQDALSRAMGVSSPHDRPAYDRLRFGVKFSIRTI